MISFTGLASVADRTIFTNKGPIVKRPLPLLAGSDLRILGSGEVSSGSAPFVSSHEGKLLTVTGSPGGRNDGTFRIAEVLSPQRVRLEEASFDIVDHAATLALVIELANDVKLQYNLHRTRTVTVDGVAEGVHATNDLTNAVLAPDAVDLPSALTLLNDIRSKLGLHVVMVSGSPPVHSGASPEDVPEAVASTQLASALLLANDVRHRFEDHRRNRFVHQNQDLVDSVSADPVSPVESGFPGTLTGPFNWTILDPRYGMVADDPFDVSVTIGGSPVAVEAVIGLLGAVVLAAKPASGSTALIDYDYMANPPARFLTLNTFEFNLNQAGNNGLSGLPSHRYRAKSYLIDPGNTPDLKSPYQPLQVGWKYKGFERAYTSSLNDPTSLLLNVPTNKLAYPVLFQKYSDSTVRYDPVALPDASADPWTLEGDGAFVLAPGGNQLTIVDSNVQTGTDSLPPFFSHPVDLQAPSSVSAAFRVRASEDESVFEPDGAFTGVAFGISDGARAVLAGLVLTEATNLTSACSLANSLKAAFNLHLIHVGSHVPDDVSDTVSVVDADDLTSLVILANDIRSQYLAHAAKGGGPGLVHSFPDGVNILLPPAADDLASAVALVNATRLAFNSHRVQSGVHFVSDLDNVVGLVKQVGLLRRGGFPEEQGSWEAVAADWTEYKTYRIQYGSDGSAALYLSGDVMPSAELGPAELPFPSSIDAKIDLAQQVFFGSVGRESKSLSDWQFVRVNIQPVEANLIEGNKQVSYDGSTVPELFPSAPWIPYGQGGTERILSGSVLSLDSTSSASFQDVPDLGVLSGAYRGFVRFEPALGAGVTSVVEASASADWWTHGVDNQSFVIAVDDLDFTLQLAFLQYSPAPATASGSSIEPFAIVDGDSLVLKVGQGQPVTVQFSIPPDVGGTAAGVAAKINAVFGFTLASAVSGRLVLTTQQLGAEARLEVVSGSALAKLGLSPGVYYGRDSSPEPRVSWFGANLPDLDGPAWNRTGDQGFELLDRTLRITDSSATDYVSYTLDDALVTNQAFGPGFDWKLDVRLAVLSFVPGPVVPASVPYQALSYAGAMVSVDEGPGGKSLELHLATDGSGAQYLNLLSFDASLNQLVVVSQYAFAWNDGREHSYNVFTSKALDQILVLADGQVLSPSVGPAPTYSGLEAGLFGPSVTFGSGSEPVVNADLRAGLSVVDWKSVSVFKDSKLGDPTAASRRYVGLYRGGPPDLLSSYYLHQIDWSVLHTYRIVRDPVSGVSVHVDGAPVPSISAPYDVLGLPPAGSSFLKPATAGKPTVAFGSFNPREMARTRWDFLRYSIGRITLTDRIVPPHQFLNQGNAVSSPDHLFTQKKHFHQGFRVYSGGTPLDDFLADSEVPAYTTLGSGTAPVPMTQDLNHRGGLVKVATPVDGVPAVDLVDERGFLTDLVDDVVNVGPSTPVPTVAASTAGLVSLVNEFKADFNSHRTQAGVHFVNDAVNVIAAPDASDLATAIVLVNESKARFNDHLTEPTVHVPDGTGAVSLPDATDLPSAVTLANALRSSYSEHVGTGDFHVTDDLTNTVTAPDATDLPTLAVLAESVRKALEAHAGSGVFHLVSDLLNASVSGRVAGLGFGTVEGLASVVADFPANPGDQIRFLEGPNSGATRPVSTVIPGGFLVAPPYPVDDASGSSFARIVSGSPSLSLATAVGLTNQLRSSLLSHLDATGVHPTDDPGSYSIPGESYDLPTAVALANALKAAVNAHLTGETVHSQTDSVNVISATAVQDPLASSVAVLNLLRSAYLGHVSSPRVHVADDDQNVVLTAEATDLASAVALANSFKSEFNDHIDGVVREIQKIHSEDDVVNAVTAPDASDLTTLAVLAEDERLKYAAHRVQPGVHGSSLLIRLDAPSRVLYEDMRFWRFETGSENADMAPFSDDETLHWDGPFGATAGASLSYLGSVLPSADRIKKIVDLANAWKAAFNSHRVQPGVHVTNDVVNVVASPDATDLPSAIVLLTDIKAKWNLHLSQPGVHLATDELDAALCPDPASAVPAASLANEVALKYRRHGLSTEFHSLADDVNLVTAEQAYGAQDAGWVRKDEGAGAVTEALVTVGPVQAFRYGTSGSGVRTAYVRKTGIPDSAPGLDARFKIRVDAYAYSPDVDTGIAVGVLTNEGPGGAVAIGFDAISNVPYVKVFDASSGEALFRIPFNWADGAFHEYRLYKDPVSGSYSLSVES